MQRVRRDGVVLAALRARSHDHRARVVLLFRHRHGRLHHGRLHGVDTWFRHGLRRHSRTRGVFRLLLLSLGGQEAGLHVAQTVDHGLHHLPVGSSALQLLYGLAHEGVLCMRRSQHHHLEQLLRGRALVRVLHQALAHEIDKVLRPATLVAQSRSGTVGNHENRLCVNPSFSAYTHGVDVRVGGNALRQLDRRDAQRPDIRLE